MKNKILITLAISLAVGRAGAFSLSSIFGKDSKAANVAAKAVDAVNPEEQVKKMIAKCTTPTTDGICECVANATVGNLTPDQWKIVNHYMFDTRRTVSVSEFLIANPWLVPKLVAPYIKCSGKA